MAVPSLHIIDALRKTANQLQNGSRYEWGHMGSCNCGNLAQTITTFSRAEIQKQALQKPGDWSEQLVEYCPSSGLPMDMIIEKMIDFGFTKQDLRYLEWLSDEIIVKEALKSGSQTHLTRNSKQDTILYMRTWANLLEDKLVAPIKLDINEQQLQLT
jgi:hypothetical protein